MNKKVKAKTFTLVVIKHKTFGIVYAFSGSRRASLCCDFVKSYLGKSRPRKIKVRVRATMAAGYTKARHRDNWVVIEGGWNRLFHDAAESLDSVFGSRKTFYFKITEAK